MNIQPVIQRELRVASRRKETWRLRLAFAGGALGAFAFGMLWPDTSPGELGRVVLICLTICGFALSLFAGPYLTADAISEERREGTLGLLFLTPLNGWQIITGKMATHALQVGYGWLAVFPIFYLPVLLGGVTAAEVARLLLVLLVTLLLSAACGLFWSTLCTEARTSVMATLGSLLLLVFLPWLGPWLQELTHGGGIGPGPVQLSPMTALVYSFEPLFNRGARSVLGLQQTGAATFWISLGAQGVLTVALLTASSCLLPRLWRRTEEGGNTATTDSGKRMSDRPAWLPELKQSPLVWFFGRDLKDSVWLRLLTGFIWIGFVIMLLLSATDVAEKGFITAFCLAYARHLILRVQFAFDATHRLQEDRRSGALELLLTTPVDEARVASAHREAMRRGGHRALMGALVMNGLLELCVFLCFRNLAMSHGAWFIFSVWFVGGAVLAWADLRTMSWLALRQTGRNRSPLKAVGVILATLQLPTWIAFGLTFALVVAGNDEAWIGLMFSLWVLACLGYNSWLIRGCRAWLRRGMRWQVAEGR